MCLGSETMNLKIGQNIIPSINFIMSSIPDNTSSLEKVRYIYINLGKLFSYDYRIIVDESVASEAIDYGDSEISRYKTCYQISEVLMLLINGLIPGCEAKLIERKIPGRHFAKEHVATEVTFSDGLKIILDLTLDLANIQGGLKTKEFGFTTNSTGEYDIISLKECAEMDKKLGFIAEKYTDDYIDEFVSILSKTDFSGKTPADIVEYKISKAKELFSKDFKGNHEAIRYIYTLLSKILSTSELSKLKQYNLSYCNSDDFNLMAIYAFDELGLYYSYSNELGFSKISPSVIASLLKNGWKTNSKTLQSIFDKPDLDDDITSSRL